MGRIQNFAALSSLQQIGCLNFDRKSRGRGAPRFNNPFSVFINIHNCGFASVVQQRVSDVG
jgi:hypothetical protein